MHANFVHHNYPFVMLMSSLYKSFDYQDNISKIYSNSFKSKSYDCFFFLFYPGRGPIIDEVYYLQGVVDVTDWDTIMIDRCQRETRFQQVGEFEINVSYYDFKYMYFVVGTLYTFL